MHHKPMQHILTQHDQLMSECTQKNKKNVHQSVLKCRKSWLLSDKQTRSGFEQSCCLLSAWEITTSLQPNSGNLWLRMVNLSSRPASLADHQLLSRIVFYIRKTQSGWRKTCEMRALAAASVSTLTDRKVKCAAFIVVHCFFFFSHSSFNCQSEHLKERLESVMKDRVSSEQEDVTWRRQINLWLIIFASWEAFILVETMWTKQFILYHCH